MDAATSSPALERSRTATRGGGVAPAASPAVSEEEERLCKERECCNSFRNCRSSSLNCRLSACTRAASELSRAFSRPSRLHSSDKRAFSSLALAETASPINCCSVAISGCSEDAEEPFAAATSGRRLSAEG